MSNSEHERRRDRLTTYTGIASTATWVALFVLAPWYIWIIALLTHSVIFGTESVLHPDPIFGISTTFIMIGLGVVPVLNTWFLYYSLFQKWYVYGDEHDL